MYSFYIYLFFQMIFLSVFLHLNYRTNVCIVSTSIYFEMIFLAVFQHLNYRKKMCIVSTSIYLSNDLTIYISKWSYYLYFYILPIVETCDDFLHLSIFLNDLTICISTSLLSYKRESIFNIYLFFKRSYYLYFYILTIVKKCV